MLHSPNLLFFFFFFFFFILLVSNTKFSFSQSRGANIKTILSCTNTTVPITDLNSFTKNYNAAISVVIARTQHKGLGFDVEDADKKHSNSTLVYAYGECLKGINPINGGFDMSDLLYEPISDECLQRKNGTRGGQAFDGQCFLRYDDHDFRGETSSVADNSLCESGGNETSSLGFRDMAGEFLRKMSLEAPKNGGFYFGMSRVYQKAIYGAAQCLEYVNDTTECERCLSSAATKGKECVSKEEGFVVNYGCFIRYAPYNFYEL